MLSEEELLKAYRKLSDTCKQRVSDHIRAIKDPKVGTDKYTKDKK